ncbi:PREDICTED: intraflagellar transport protein 140 homolog [Amphimedon queenslandica]|uniref:IFT140 first beta-propeller domain-containing protein n=2 Tax=Amphimedon queenslandica TaxID=400682 RepID=A0AAN0IXE6_AMPQE|nr:PREDICTED: intraflagellar transport protein 140 homolog [Amphimedon queenslandica]|eukprot:XP_019849222.1 PREDICTED: intraflagellar transport protein 140 homolog [Amphimedon queenslandica]
MSVYFTHPVRSPLEGSAFIDVSWHSTYSLLAVLAERKSPDRGMVFICHDEGELIADMCVERSHLAETISWHPERKILAIGWSSGEITTCNAYENEIFSVSSHHHSNVNIIRWSLTGNHIISADKSGLVLLWQIESKGELYSSPVHQTKVAGVVTHCVLLGADPK